MQHCYNELFTACVKLIQEDKDANSRTILSDVVQNLKENRLGDKKTELLGTGEDSEPRSNSSSLCKTELNEAEVIRLGFACRIALLASCGNRFSSKYVIASLELAIVLLNSGFIPIRFVCTPLEIKSPKNCTKRADEFFSKSCSGDGSSQNSTLANDGNTNIMKKEESDGKIVLFVAVVEGVLTVAQQIEGKEVSDKLLFTLVTALRASAVPRCSRVRFSDKDENDFYQNRLLLRGDLLLQTVKALFGVLARNNAILPLVDEAKAALNQIAKALSKAVELGISSSFTSQQEIPEHIQCQVDAGQFLEYCCEVTKASVVPSTRFQGGAANVVSSSNVHSIELLTALGLILHLTVNAGPVFRNSSQILLTLKSVVVPCAIRTAFLKDLDAFRLSLNILLTCTITFGPQMVNETEAIFRHVFFRVLESKSSSFTQKSLVVEVFRRYIEEPQNLLSLFLNYDCNERSQSIYEEMIVHLSALSLPPGVVNVDTKDRADLMEEKLSLTFFVPETLQRRALTTLLLVAYSNVQWIERFECDQTKSIIEAKRIRNESVESNVSIEFENSKFDGLLSAGPEKGNDNFVYGLRKKEAFRKFLSLMNELKDATAAIDFFLNEPLISSPTHDGRTVLPKEDALVEDNKKRMFENKVFFKSHDDVENPVRSSEIEMDSKAFKVAKFLKECEDYLDKLVLGEYFAKSFRRPFSRLVFVKWIELHSFTGLSLDEALRLFLGGFKLLGEAEVVDKTMELFASQYCKEHPTAFRSANTAFILSFSICMLNTDAHSPHVKDKMTLDSFVRNNRGIDEGNDVDVDLLKGIYERITKNEIKLRPPSKLVSCSTNTLKTGRESRSSSPSKLSSSLLETIPILRHFAPMARAITDTVMIPVDIAGNMLFNTVERKEQELLQIELRIALKDVIEALNTADALTSRFVQATTIENAIPMWAITVDGLVSTLLSSFESFFYQVESSALHSNAQGGVDSSTLYMEISQNREYFDSILRGVINTVRVCCDFGNVLQVEHLIKRLFELTRLENIISVCVHDGVSVVSVSNAISKPRIELLATLLNLFITNGGVLTTKSWYVAYTAISLLDLVANGIEGIWRRERAKGSSSDAVQPVSPDTWFGKLENVPNTIDKKSIHLRARILSDLRCFSHVDLWLERLFDATEYPSQAQVFMANSLVNICENELRCLRTFSLTKLFDFVTVCATFSSRMQWRDLWANASKVFTLAGTMSFGIANSALDGLRIIALTYLTREELLNYSFQKEVLTPFEAILMGNQDSNIRQKVIEIISELIDIRACLLASGWNVVFAILSHSAVIPEVVKPAWRVCESIITSHVSLMKDSFRDLIFCLTSFACNNVNEGIALLSTSYLRACGHWLQFGLEAPPHDVREPSAVSEWSGRFLDVDSEACAALHIAQTLPRVSMSVVPITSKEKLERSLILSAKTSYHLWMQLLEGMIPIILVHSSVRVRAHVICTLWALIGYYAVAFSTDIQEYLFISILRPVISSLILHAPSDDDSHFDSLDYKLLAFLSLKSMFVACCRHSHILSLACETFTSICGTPASLRLFQSGFADVLLRICVDLCPKVSQDNGREKVLERWVVRLTHEWQQMGFVDVVNFKRTASWTELHKSAAVTARTIDIDPIVSGKMRTFLNDAVFKAVSEMIVSQLLGISARCTIQEDILLCSKAVRRSFLVLALYCSRLECIESALPVLLSGFSVVCSEVPEQLLLIPYLCVLVELVFTLRSESPDSNVLHMIGTSIDSMCETARKSRDFCIKHQTEYLEVVEHERAAKGFLTSAAKKHRGCTFIDFFRTGREMLGARAKHISHQSKSEYQERIQHEWVYLTHVVGLKCVFAFGGIMACSARLTTLQKVVLILPSEIEEELVRVFFDSCWNELDVGIGLSKNSTISLALDLFGQREPRLTVREKM